MYQRIVTDGKPGKWTKIKAITDNSAREWKVELEKGNVYEFVVTATNELGESLKEDGKIKRVKATGGMFYFYLCFVSLNKRGLFAYKYDRIYTIRYADL